MQQNGFDPYAGGAFYHVGQADRCLADGYQSPLQLLFFSRIIPITSLLFTTMLWIGADVLAALTLVRIWRLKSSGRTKPSQRDALVALMYVSKPLGSLTEQLPLQPVFDSDLCSKIDHSA